MLEEQRNITEYLLDYKNGKIKMGKEIGIPSFDSVLRYKQGQFVIINGLDNVGKSVWILWYFLCLSNRHGLTWCVWCGENGAGQLTRQLIEFQTGKKLKDLSEVEIMKNELIIQGYFKFVDNSRLYTSTELFKIFKDSGCHGGLVDPYTGLNRKYTHEANYDFLNEARQFCNQHKITIYVNTHPVTEAARRTYSIDHPLYAGYPMPPSKSQSEGGQSFANRPDDFITIHRLVGHSEMKYKTLLYIRKVKDTETGGEPTGIDEPIEFDYNSGLGFTVNGHNPLNNTVKNDLDLSELPINEDFDNNDVPF